MNQRELVSLALVAVWIALLSLPAHFSLNTYLAFAHNSTPAIQEDSLAVSASQTNVDRGGIVTISVTTFAHRTGSGVLDTNWSIQLSVPSGYTITTGANPQTKTTSKHGSATVTWQVSTPSVPSGPDIFTVTASATDATFGTALSGSPEVDTLTITTVNRVPTANSDTVTIAEDIVSTIINVLTNDTDSDNDTILINSISSQPFNGTAQVTDSNTTITYSPDANFFGTDYLTYTIHDGYGGLAAATVTINVTAVNDVPVATTDSYETDEDTLLIVSGLGIIENDTDAESDTLSAILKQDSKNGTLTLYSNGSLQYEPITDFNGIDRFSYLANDGELDGNIAIVNITVSAVNDSPVANNATFTVDEDEQTVITLDGFDVDDDIENLTFAIVTNPAHGTLSGFNALSGVVIYVPAPDFNGQDIFLFMISDGTASSRSAFVTLTVNPVDEAAEDQDVDDGREDRDRGNNDRRDYGEEELASERITYEDSYFNDKPLKRLQIQSQSVINSDGASFASVSRGEEVTFSYSFRNYQQKSQPYYFIVQIVDEEGVTVAIQFSKGELAKGERAEVQQEWVPENASEYVANVFIWDQLEKPSPLADISKSIIRVR